MRSLDTEAGAILSGFACIAVFFVMKSGLSRFAQMDIGDFKSTAIKIGGAAGSPILGAMDFPHIRCSMRVSGAALVRMTPGMSRLTKTNLQARTTTRTTTCPT